MDILLDTASLELIKTCSEIFTIKGVTTNPTITARCKRDDIDPYVMLKEISDYLSESSLELHIQVLSTEKSEIIREALRIKEYFGGSISVKIPVTTEGLKAIGVLADKGVKVTATAIYSYAQAILAHYRGASDLALYCNRMELMGTDYAKVIQEIKATDAKARILSASFKSFEQIKRAILAGSDAVTVNPEYIQGELDKPHIIKDVAAFSSDWRKAFSDIAL